MSRITRATRTRGAAPSHSPPDMTFAPGAGMAKGLGWFSIALGVSQLIATRQVCRATGIRDENLMKCCGLRELASGVALLAFDRPTFGIWTRIAGDVMDLAILADAIVDNDRDSQLRAVEAAAAVAGVTALDMLSALQLSAAEKLEG